MGVSEKDEVENKTIDVETQEGVNEVNLPDG